MNGWPEFTNTEFFIILFIAALIVVGLLLGA